MELMDACQVDWACSVLVRAIVFFRVGDCCVLLHVVLCVSRCRCVTSLEPVSAFMSCVRSSLSFEHRGSYFQFAGLRRELFAS